MPKQRGILGNTILGVMTLGIYMPLTVMKLATGLSLSNDILLADRNEESEPMSEPNTNFKIETWTTEAQITMTATAESKVAMLENELCYRERLNQRPIRIRITKVY